MTYEDEEADECERRIERWRKRARRQRIPEFVEKDGALRLAKEDDEQAHVALSETTGIPAGPGSAHLVQQVAACVARQVADRAEAANRAANLMRGVKPRDAIEGMIAAQLVATHHASLEMLSRALNPDQPSEIANQCTIRAERLLKRYTELVVALSRYRGRTTEQRVTVEHVTVEPGGQAIVGSVTKNG